MPVSTGFFCMKTRCFEGPAVRTIPDRSWGKAPAASAIPGSSAGAAGSSRSTELWTWTPTHPAAFRKQMHDEHCYFNTSGLSGGFGHRLHPA